MKDKQNLTIDDIARELGVSKTTVSRAISGKGRIGTSTRERVLSYIEKHNYRPSTAAKGLAERKTYNLALVLPKSFIKLDLPFIRQSMSAICEEAYRRDYSILLCLSFEDTAEALIRTLDNRKVDGVILSRTLEKDAVAAYLLEHGIPFATMGSLPPSLSGQATVEVDNDHLGGAKALSCQLLAGSDSPVAVIGGDMNHMVNQRRLEGIRQAAACFPNVPCSIHTKLHHNDQCAQEVDKLLAAGIRRFIAMDDDICSVIVSRIRQAGLQIPEDVHIISLYDNESGTNASEAVTVLRFDEESLGRSACRELLNYLAGEEYASSVSLDYRIISRGTE